MIDRVSDRPSNEFWSKAREMVEWCSPEELRVLRIMAEKEMEKRLKKWDQKLELKASDEKAKKARAIRRQISKEGSNGAKTASN